MTSSQIDMATWNSLSKDEKHSVAKSIVTNLKKKGLEDIAFIDIEEKTIGERVFSIARFESYGDIFHLVPGGRAEIGFDVETFRPPKELLLDYALGGVWGETDENLKKSLSYGITPPQMIDFPSLLVEPKPSEKDGERYWFTKENVNKLAQDDPSMTMWLKDYPQYVMPKPRKNCKKDYSIGTLCHSAQTEISKGARKFFTHVKLSCEGTNKAQLIVYEYKSFDIFQNELKAKGRRLPTEQEWQRLNMAGGTGLFSWGDFCPLEKKSYDAFMTELNKSLKMGGAEAEEALEISDYIKLVFSYFKEEDLMRPIGAKEYLMMQDSNLWGLCFPDNQIDTELVIGTRTWNNKTKQHVCSVGGGASAHGMGWGDFVEWCAISPHYQDCNAISFDEENRPKGDYSSILHRNVIDLTV